MKPADNELLKPEDIETSDSGEESSDKRPAYIPPDMQYNPMGKTGEPKRIGPELNN